MWAVRGASRSDRDCRRHESLTRSPIVARPGRSSGRCPRSSAGQSNGLLIRRAQVRILPRARTARPGWRHVWVILRAGSVRDVTRTRVAAALTQWPDGDGGAGTTRDRARRAQATGGALDPTLPVTLHFHPDCLEEGTVLEAIAAEGYYRSQFETGTSNGGLTAHAGRRPVELGITHVRRRLRRRSDPGLRPKYGSLNDRREPVRRVAPVRFGVLRGRPARRSTG